MSACSERVGIESSASGLVPGTACGCGIGSDEPPPPPSPRKNEIFLFSVPRPIRSMHRSEGWSPDTIASDLLPAFRSSFHPLQRSADVFCWDPV